MHMPSSELLYALPQVATPEDLKALISSGCITFPVGIPGFPALRQADIVTGEGIDPFFYMRARNIAQLAFVCVEPLVVCADYSLTIPDAFAKELDLWNTGEIWLISLVTLTENCQDITANLMCPIVVNIRTRQARQLVCEDRENLLRFRIWDHLQTVEADPELEVAGAIVA